MEEGDFSAKTASPLSALTPVSSSSPCARVAVNLFQNQDCLSALKRQLAVQTGQHLPSVGGLN